MPTADGCSGIAPIVVAQSCAAGAASLLLDARRGGATPACRWRLAGLVTQRAVCATVTVVSSRWVATSTGGWLRSRPNSPLVQRVEWGASIAAGGASFAAGLAATCRVGGGVRSAGALVLPAFYATLSTLESLMLWRAAQPGTYETAFSSLLGCIPLVFAPCSLRMILAAPLLLPPLAAQWLEEAGSGGGGTPAALMGTPLAVVGDTGHAAEASAVHATGRKLAATFSGGLALGASSVGGMGSSLATKAACTVAHVGEGAAEVATDMGAALVLFGGAACRLPASTNLPAAPNELALSYCSHNAASATLAAAAAAAEAASV